MKLNKTILAAGLVLGFASMANAADQGQGTVTFNGSIIDAPCSIAAGSDSQTVEMGQISNVALQNGGKSSSHDFNIKLENCDISTFKNVEISFNGVGDADNSKLVSVSTEPGAATGVGIGIYDNTNTLVDLNTGKSATVLKEGQTVLYFTANYVSTKDAVTKGYGNAEVDFNLTYN